MVTGAWNESKHCLLGLFAQPFCSLFTAMSHLLFSKVDSRFVHCFTCEIYRSPWRVLLFSYLHQQNLDDHFSHRSVNPCLTFRMQYLPQTSKAVLQTSFGVIPAPCKTPVPHATDKSRFESVLGLCVNDKTITARLFYIKKYSL